MACLSKVMTMHNLWRAKLLYDLNYGQPNFRSRDSKKVQEIISEAGKGSYAETMYEAAPQSITQVVIMLSTGTPTWTQGISLVSSVLSLSWGASRTFMMLRPSDKADADPELITVSLRIWPYVLEQFGSKSMNMRNLDVSYVRSFLLNLLMLLGFVNCLMTRANKNCD